MTRVAAIVTAARRSIGRRRREQPGNAKTTRHIIPAVLWRPGVVIATSNARDEYTPPTPPSDRTHR